MAEVHLRTLTPCPKIVQQIREFKEGPDVMLNGAHLRNEVQLYWTDRLVGRHSDSIEPGYLTFIWVLLNDMQCRLGESSGELTDLPPGRLLSFDSTQPHYTLWGRGGQECKGRFGFIAWDMDGEKYNLHRFRQELMDEFHLEAF